MEEHGEEFVNMTNEFVFAHMRWTFTGMLIFKVINQKVKVMGKVDAFPSYVDQKLKKSLYCWLFFQVFVPYAEVIVWLYKSSRK